MATRHHGCSTVPSLRTMRGRGRSKSRSFIVPAADDQSRTYVHRLLTLMSRAGASDMFIANDFPPSVKIHGNMQPMLSEKLTGEITRKLAHAMMNERQREEFERELECNFAIAVPGLSRFRVNVFIQQQHVGMVFRPIHAEIPTVHKFGLLAII